MGVCQNRGEFIFSNKYLLFSGGKNILVKISA
jgi:hypothetical protein